MADDVIELFVRLAHAGREAVVVVATIVIDLGLRIPHVLWLLRGLLLVHVRVGPVLLGHIMQVLLRNTCVLSVAVGRGLLLLVLLGLVDAWGAER